MPTADEFRSAARALEQRADNLDAASTHLENLRDGLKLTSPTYRELLDQGYSGATSQVASMAETARAAAAEFTRRADVCDDYAEQLRTYYYRHDYLYATKQIDIEPRRPPRPASWVEV